MIPNRLHLNLYLYLRNLFHRTPSSSKFLFEKHALASVTRSGTNVFLRNTRKTKCQRSTEFFKRKNFDGAGCFMIVSKSFAIAYLLHQFISDLKIPLIILFQFCFAIFCIHSHETMIDLPFDGFRKCLCKLFRLQVLHGIL